ncbi:MAG TPA: hypothetical protein VK918_10310 [Pyrinomonadaceae bacterium]|nr:hypothetical protein [Pyrinomonadaceae bacterium]
MLPKVVAFVITFAVNLVIAAACLFFLLLALNGFHESDANWGIGAFLLIVLAASAGTALAAAGGVHFLMSRKGFGAALSLAIFVPLFVVVGGTISFVGILIGALVADIARGM